MDMITWFSILSADLVALLLFFLSYVIVKKGLGFSTLLLFIRDPKYYYLTFIHERAYAELLNGTKNAEIIRILQERPFSFLHDPRANNTDALSFIELVLEDKSILETYILQKQFDKSIYHEICKGINESQKEKDLADCFRKILKDTSQKGVSQAKRIFKEWLSQPFPVQQEFEDTIKKGKNQVMLYKAGEKHLFKRGTTQKDFVACLKALKKLNPDIIIVTAPAMSGAKITNPELTNCEKHLEKLLYQTGD